MPGSHSPPPPRGRRGHTADAPPDRGPRRGSRRHVPRERVPGSRTVPRDRGRTAIRRRGPRGEGARCGLWAARPGPGGVETGPENVLDGLGRVESPPLPPRRSAGPRTSRCGPPPARTRAVPAAIGLRTTPHPDKQLPLPARPARGKARRKAAGPPPAAMQAAATAQVVTSVHSLAAPPDVPAATVPTVRSHRAASAEAAPAGPSPAATAPDVRSHRVGSARRRAGRGHRGAGAPAA